MSFTNFSLNTYIFHYEKNSLKFTKHYEILKLIINALKIEIKRISSLYGRKILIFTFLQIFSFLFQLIVFKPHFQAN